MTAAHVAILFAVVAVASAPIGSRIGRFLSLANLHPDDDEALQQARDQQSEGQGGFTQSHGSANK